MDNQNRIRRNFLKTSISHRLKCPICFEVFYKPRRLFCGHTFCKPCLKELFKPHKNPQHIQTCPLCRTTIDVKNIGYDMLAIKIIDELQVSCPVKGCPWKGQNSLLETHYNFSCKMKDYYKQSGNIKKISALQSDYSGKQDDVVQRINQNVQKGSLISRIISKNPHLLKNIRKQQQQLIKIRDGIPRLIDSVPLYSRLDQKRTENILNPKRPNQMHRINYDQPLVIYGPPNEMIRKIAQKKRLKRLQQLSSGKATLQADLNMIQQLQRSMGLHLKDKNKNNSDEWLIKKQKPLIINLMDKS